ncbi:MAG: hypothetical protein ACRCZ0_12135 [Cetobacterium sp.]
MKDIFKEFLTKEEQDIRKGVTRLVSKGVTPKLRILTDDKDAKCKAYMRSKLAKADILGIQAEVVTVNNIEILSKVLEDSVVKGIPTILQKPIDSSMEATYRDFLDIKSIDVDGFFTQEDYFEGDFDIAPATPKGILNFIMDSNGLDLDCSEKSLVILGRGDLVGKPLSIMALPYFGSVTVLTSKSNKLVVRDSIKSADFVVLSTGVVGSVKASKLNRDKEVYVFNVGTIVDSEGRLAMELCQDYELDSIKVSPRIGGVGLLTVLALMDNVVNYYIKKWGH